MDKLEKHEDAELSFDAIQYYKLFDLLTNVHITNRQLTTVSLALLLMFCGFVRLVIRMEMVQDKRSCYRTFVLHGNLFLDQRRYIRSQKEYLMFKKAFCMIR